ncbi:sodium/solute symporter [Sinomicrobium kalidii]|uniref:sodium:solute symporter family transporter n=1 Tax=Sinomicrobium kalidii TaxID=2900738 RepID=UPI001E3B0874|nr:sodium/solute symporter [Sinomicrobium kalidii]UGU17413.1 sodium/solute symporter [Sinomicrobium kalidii]
MFFVKRSFFYGFLVTCLFSLPLFAQESNNAPAVQLDQLLELPELSGENPQLGYAGMMGGMHNGVIMAAGGANFPGTPPWKGGEKVWSRDIYTFRDGKWELSAVRLPVALAYGASVKTPEGVLCMGGNNESEVSDRVFLLQYDNGIRIKPCPSLPLPLSYLSAVLEGDYVYAIGGKDSHQTYATVYRWKYGTDEPWEKMPDFPGTPRSLHCSVIQETGESRKIFVIGGQNFVKGEPTQLLQTYLSYDLNTGEWSGEKPIAINGKPRVVMSGTAMAAGSMHVLMLGGSDGKLFSLLEKLDHRIRELPASAPERNRTIHYRDSILENHPGFGDQIVALNTVTGKWTIRDTLPRPLPVTTLGFSEGNSFFIISGEASPGIRTPEVLQLRLSERPASFGTVNYVILVLYLLLMAGIGLYFSRKQHSTADYFKGGGRIPWWAAGISVFGTLLSALTFMAIPAKTFLTDWSYFLINMMIICMAPFIARRFIPYFNRLNITTAYEFLENRFNYTARAIGSLSFLLFQLGRIGIILLLPSLAISIVTGIPVETSVIIMGVICIFYTAYGGIEAVIWTDVLQVIILLGGAVLSIVWIFTHTDLGPQEMFTFAESRGKLRLTYPDFSFSTPTFWVVVLGGLASALVTQGTDQTVVQRYLTSTTVKDAKRTLYTNAVMTFPATIIFFAIGTLLYIFYSEKPERLPLDLSNGDSIFPWYIVHELPVGISGVLIAAIFSAAMSSISSSLNSTATVFCNDFYKRFVPDTADLKLLKIARAGTVIMGVLGLLLALWMANASIKSLWDQFFKFIGFLTGGLGGMFLLGILTKKANAPGTLTGVALSVLVTWYISLYTDIHFLMFSFVGVVTCYISGYLLSLVFGRSAGTKQGF